MVPRQSLHKTYTILVCPHNGDACIDHNHDPVAIEVVPKEKIAELEKTRVSQGERLKHYRDRHPVAVTVGEVTLFGTREAAEKAKATIAHLQAKAKGRAS